MGKIILQQTQLVVDNTPGQGEVAVAVASKRPSGHVPKPGDPKTSPCWIKWLIVAAHRQNVPAVRLAFSAVTGVPPEDLENVIAIESIGNSQAFALALQAFGIDPQGLAPMGEFFPQSCSIGGRDALVTRTADSVPSTITADWCILKGEHIRADCVAEEAKVWTGPLSPEDINEINEEVSKPTTFECA